MAEKLMRWNGSEWVEVSCVNRTDIQIKKGLGKLFVTEFNEPFSPYTEKTPFLFSEKKLQPKIMKINGLTLI